MYSKILNWCSSFLMTCEVSVAYYNTEQVIVLFSSNSLRVNFWREKYTLTFSNPIWNSTCLLLQLLVFTQRWLKLDVLLNVKLFICRFLDHFMTVFPLWQPYILSFHYLYWNQFQSIPICIYRNILYKYIYIPSVYM